MVDGATDARVVDVGATTGTEEVVGDAGALVGTIVVVVVTLVVVVVVVITLVEEARPVAAGWDSLTTSTTTRTAERTTRAATSILSRVVMGTHIRPSVTAAPGDGARAVGPSTRSGP